MSDNQTVEALVSKDSSGLRVCVFCSANDLEPKYIEPAKKFARLLAESGYTLVWGGSDRGLMKIVASGAQDAGARIVGVSVEYLRDKARENADEMTFAKDLGERKALMLEKSDAIVMMVGGIGTLDEATEVLEYKKHGHHDKPVVVLNTDGFYDGLKIQMEKMEEEGFLKHEVSHYVCFADTPEEAIKYLKRHPNSS